MKNYAVITGASSGIGRETAKKLGNLDYNLVLAARRKERLLDLKEEILVSNPKLKITVKEVDLSKKDNIIPFYKSIRELPIEIFINNAGIGDYDYLYKEDIEKIEDLINLNVMAVVLLSKLFVSDFIDQNAVLVNVSSCGGYTLVPEATTYCASKYFVSAFTEGLALELQELGAKLRAKVFAPAATETEFGKKANGVKEYDYDQHFKNFNSADETAVYLVNLIKSDKTVGLVDRESFEFILSDPLFNNAYKSTYNQRFTNFTDLKFTKQK